MESTEFLKVLILVYEYDDVDELIGKSNGKSYKRQILIPFINIFFIQEALDKRETEIMLIDGETIYALEKFAIIEAKWQEWSNENNSLLKKTKFN
tara:strand:+ start:675 stop:959 length:285 start_codon:yes stop_codon:yes gene_type:complete